MFRLLHERMWDEDPHEAKGKCEFSGAAAAYASYGEGPGDPVEQQANLEPAMCPCKE